MEAVVATRYTGNYDEYHIASSFKELMEAVEDIYQRAGRQDKLEHIYRRTAAKVEILYYPAGKDDS
jgi:hypothetical protein